MRLALEEAELAAREGEVPVGAVVVQNDRCIAKAHNLCERTCDATAHAERLVIATACRYLGTWRLSDCTLYVTLEPCSMCAGAAINARISRIVYAAKDARAGALGSIVDLSAFPLEVRPSVENGLFAEDSRNLLQCFFRKLRSESENANVGR